MIWPCRFICAILRLREPDDDIRQLANACLLKGRTVDKEVLIALMAAITQRVQWVKDFGETQQSAINTLAAGMGIESRYGASFYCLLPHA